MSKKELNNEDEFFYYNGDLRIWWNTATRATYRPAADVESARMRLEDQMHEQGDAIEAVGMEVLQNGVFVDWRSEDGLTMSEYIKAHRENYERAAAQVAAADKVHEQITSTSTLTDVLSALKEQGIERLPIYNSVNHELARHEAGRWGAQGYVFMTADGMVEWDDTRYLTLHYGATSGDGGQIMTVAFQIRDALAVAGFDTDDAGSTSITLHVPKSRF